jgi:hypothetical protein
MIIWYFCDHLGNSYIDKMILRSNSFVTHSSPFWYVVPKTSGNPDPLASNLHFSDLLHHHQHLPFEDAASSNTAFELGSDIRLADYMLSDYT